MRGSGTLNCVIKMVWKTRFKDRGKKHRLQINAQLLNKNWRFFLRGGGHFDTTTLLICLKTLFLFSFRFYLNGISFEFIELYIKIYDKFIKIRDKFIKTCDKFSEILFYENQNWKNWSLEIYTVCSCILDVVWYIINKYIYNPHGTK